MSIYKYYIITYTYIYFEAAIYIVLITNVDLKLYNFYAFFFKGTSPFFFNYNIRFFFINTFFKINFDFNL